MDEHNNQGDSSDDELVVSSDDEQERFGRRLPRTRYTTVDNDDEDNDNNHRRRGKRSREEAIYGVFMDGDDSEDEGFRKRRRKKTFFKESSSSSSKLAPLFVKGDVLQDKEEQDKDSGDQIKDDENKKQSSPENQEQSTSDVKPKEPPLPPTEAELAMQRQREEANQKFMALLERSKGKRARPTMASENVTDDDVSSTKAPGLGMQGKTKEPTSAAAFSPDPSSFTSAGAMPALGLGMAPKQEQPIKKDPNLGKWEKHTKGIGMKLLAKMGYKGAGGLGSKRRLAEQKTGISRALEVKVRPANLGLGYGGFREASTLKVNRQLEAQVRGEAVPEAESAKTGDSAAASHSTSHNASALPTVDELLKDSAWQKGARDAKKKKEKKKRTVIPYNQLLESKEKEHQPMKIVDLRGPQVSAANTSDATADESRPQSGPPDLGEELLHNVSLLLSTHESKLHSHSQFASAAEQKLHSLHTEVADLERQQATIQERRQKMERAAGIFEVYHSQLKNGGFDNANQTQLEAAVEMIQELSGVFSVDDRKAIQFNTSLAPVLLGDALESTLKRWNPLRKSANEGDSIRLVESIIQLPLDLDKESTNALKLDLFVKYLLPKIQKSYESAHWDAQERPDVAVRFYEKLLELVRQGFQTTEKEDDSVEDISRVNDIVDKVRRTVIFEAVHPKLEHALSSWKPSLGDDLKLVNPPHEWILPWVPFLDHPGILPTLMAQCKRRLESAVSFLSRKISDDDEAFLNSFVSALRPWSRAFKSSSVHDLTSKYASERLAASLRKSDIEATRLRVMEMHDCGLLSLIDFLALVEYDLLHRVLVPLHEQASSAKANTGKLAESYVQGKFGLESLLKDYPISRMALYSDEIVSRCFLGMLRIVEAVNKSEFKSLARLEAPSHSISFTAIRARRVRDRKRRAQAEMLRMESGNKDKLATQTREQFIRQENNDKATFREVVEEFCLQESIPFVPRTTGAWTHVDGKQVFLFGTIPVYLDSDVVFVHEGKDQWEPTSLESLLERART